MTGKEYRDSQLMMFAIESWIRDYHEERQQFPPISVFIREFTAKVNEEIYEPEEDHDAVAMELLRKCIESSRLCEDAWLNEEDGIIVIAPMYETN